MRVLLMQPPIVIHKTDLPEISQPLGLAYIAAFLKKHGYEVSILDPIILDPKGRKEGNWIHIGLDWDNIADKVSTYKPGMVGISSMYTSQKEAAHRLLNVVKDIDRNIVTVVGGAHPSAVPQEVLADRNVDYVVVGEGELTMLQILQHLENHLSLGEIEGIGYRRNDEFVIKHRLNLIEDLDSLPFPAWDLLEMDRYARHKVRHPGNKSVPYFGVCTSRGCPMNCLFCSVRTIWGRHWRARSAKNVVDEIETLRKNYGIEMIEFVDDSLLVNKKRMDEICDEILRRKLNISWMGSVNIDHVQRDLLRKMRKSGCISIDFGIESGNQEIRDKIIRKPISVEHAKEVMKWCRDLNIWTNAFFIVGIPGENEKTFLETINFSKELNSDSASFFVSRLIPGTDLWRLCEEGGYIEKGVDSLDEKAKATLHMIRTEAFTPEDLQKWRVRGYRAYAWHVLKREVCRLNLIRRLVKIRSLSDVNFLFKIGFAAYLRLVGKG